MSSRIPCVGGPNHGQIVEMDTDGAEHVELVDFVQSVHLSREAKTVGLGLTHEFGRAPGTAVYRLTMVGWCVGALRLEGLILLMDGLDAKDAARDGIALCLSSMLGHH